MDASHDGHRERLRERYEKTGIDGFLEHEVLELMLTYAIARKNTNGIAHSLIKRFGSIGAVVNASVSELTRVEGVGDRTAIFLRLFSELPAYISLHSSLKKGERLSTPTKAAAFARELMRNERYECLYIVCLNKNYELINAEKLISGTLTETPFYPRLIVEAALRHSAFAVLLVHNHPSGDPTPSDDDVSSTQAMKTALGNIDIMLYDHVIVGREYCYSITRGIYINKQNDSHRLLSTPQLTDSGGMSSELKAAEKKL